MATPELSDYGWLVGPAGAEWIARAGEDSDPLARRVARLRKELSAPRTHLVLEQVELRRRGRDKFEAAGRMFFTGKGLEQASDQWLAAYKADRLPAGQPVADLCCGIGGDLLAMAGRGPAVGVERDPAVALLAEANLESLGLRAEVRAEDAVHFPLADVTAWHVDPDRRPTGRRTTRVELHEPDLSILQRQIDAQESAAIKLSPATQVTPDWQRRAELEWISRGGQCRQLVAWFGRLTQEPGRRRATIVAPAAEGFTRFASWVADAAATLPIAERVGRYLFDPDPAILAADMLATVAVAEGLEALAARGGYLTADRPIERPGLARFEVAEVLPLDVKRMARLLAERGIGRLEIKKRAVDVDPEELRRRLKLKGDADGVLVVAPVGSGVKAVLARRV